MLSNKIKSISTLSENSVKIDDLICPICCSTLMEPVLLPCRHGFCLTCFNGVVKYNSLICPCCRKRFATWLRIAKKANTLIDQELWSFIKKNKSEQKDIKKRSKKDSVDPINDISSVTAPPNKTEISQPGEIRKEYQEQIEAFRKQVEIEKENELKATKKFLIELFKKESKNLRTAEEHKGNETMLVANPGHTPYSLNTKKNFTTKPTFTKTSEDDKRNSSTLTASSSQLVKNLKTISVRINRGSELIKQTVQKALLSKFPSQFASGKGILTVPPTDTHKSPDRNSGSTDSLKQEMCHFKPIRTVPTTPSKRSNLTLKTPKPRKILLRDRNLNHIVSPKGRTLSEILLTSKESAFCHVRPYKNLLSQKNEISSKPASSITILFRNQLLSPKLTEKILRRKNPVVRLKRCQLDKVTEPVNTSKRVRTGLVTTKVPPLRPLKRKANGQIVKNIQSPRKVRRTNQHKDLVENPILTVTKNSEEVATLEKLIEEQKKCEEIIIQERIDFELAKKIAKRSPKKGNRNTTHNNVEFVRNLRRRTTRNSVKT